jgi:hypothetical protein
MARAGNYIKVTSSPSATRRSERKALFEGPLFGGAAAGTYMLRVLSIALGVTAFVPGHRSRLRRRVRHGWRRAGVRPTHD